MDELSERTVIESEAIGCVKTAKAAAADRAAALGIQREAILEWRPATRAEKLRAQWLRFFETSRTYRNTRRFLQSIATDPAVIREKQGKKCVKGCLDFGSTALGELG